MNTKQKAAREKMKPLRDFSIVGRHGGVVIVVRERTSTLALLRARELTGRNDLDDLAIAPDAVAQ